MSLPIQMSENIAFYKAAPAEPKDNSSYLLLHGLGNSLDFWTDIAPELAQTRPTTAIDIPGFGRSATPPNGFTLDHISQAIGKFCDTSNIEDCVLIAHSLGTFIALNIAAQAPKRFKRLILVDGTLTRAAELIQDPKQAVKDPSLAVFVSAQFLGGMLPLRRRRASIISRTRIIRDLTMWPFVANPDSLNSDLLTAALADNSGRNVLKVLTEARSVRYEALMSAISQPVDLVWGAKDRLITRQDIQQARRHMNVKRELEIPDCGHWPMIEKPSTLIEFLLSFDSD